MKKLFFILVLTIITMNGFAQGVILHYDFSAVCETGQTLYYLITNEGEHTVTLTHPYSEENNFFQGDYYEGFPKPQGEITLPSSVEYNDTQYAVTAIGDNAFYGCSDLTGTLTIPEGVVSIGCRSFCRCNFTSVTIPQSLEVIVSSSYGYGTAFVYCSALESIVVDEENPIFYSENNAIIRREGGVLVQGCKSTTIPNDIATIGRSAFQGAGDGGNLTLPNSVKDVKDYAFYECHFSGAIAFSDSLQSIGACAFEYSDFSGSLTIPNSVTEIDKGAFANCYRLTGDLTLPSTISTISIRSFSGVGCTGTLIIPNSVTSIERQAFQHCDFSELVLGNAVETIGDDAFRSIYSSIHLTGALKLPSSLTAIGRAVFAYNSFEEIHSPNTTPPALDNSAFDNYTNSDIPVYIPFGCTEVYQNAVGWNRFTNFIESEMNLEGEWYYEIQNENGSKTYQHLEYANDTTINDKDRVKVIVRTNHIYDKGFQTEVTHEYVYEEDGVVYWWNKELQEFTVLYNLVAEVGDEWEIKVGTESLIMHVDAVEDYEYEGKAFRMLRVNDAGDFFSGDIVAGFGHLTSFFPEKLMRQSAKIEVKGLRCYWVDGALLYHQGNEDCDTIYNSYHGMDEFVTDHFMIYPNPTDGVIHLEMQDAACPRYCVTNLLGQTLMSGTISGQTIDVSTLPAGMYFITIDSKTMKFAKQ